MVVAVACRPAATCSPAPQIRVHPATQADDDWTPAESLAYHVYVATSPDRLALDDVPSLPAVSRTSADRGSELVIEAPGGPEPRQPLTLGTWYVAVRAIDEAGNLGPASAPVAFDVPDGSGCAAAGGGGGAPAGLAVVMALLVGGQARDRQRRRAVDHVAPDR